MHLILDRFVAAIAAWRAAAPQRSGELEQLLRARNASARVPPPAPGSDPRTAVLRSRELRVREALADTGPDGDGRT